MPPELVLARSLSGPTQEQVQLNIERITNGGIRWYIEEGGEFVLMEPDQSSSLEAAFLVHGSSAGSASTGSLSIGNGSAAEGDRSGAGSNRNSTSPAAPAGAQARIVWKGTKMVADVTAMTLVQDHTATAAVRASATGTGAKVRLRMLEARRQDGILRQVRTTREGGREG